MLRKRRGEPLSLPRAGLFRGLNCAFFRARGPSCMAAIGRSFRLSECVDEPAINRFTFALANCRFRELRGGQVH